MAGAKSGGAEMAYVDMLRAQKQAGIGVYAATRANAHRSPLLKQAGIPVFELPFGGVFDFKTKKSIEQIIRDVKPDIVQTWMTRAVQKTPCSHKGLPPFVKIARLGGYYKMTHYQDADFFIAQTQDLKRHIAQTGSVGTDRICQINQFSEVGAAGGTLTRSEMNTPHDAFVFLSLARYHVNKALDTLIQAFASVPDAHLWLAGDGPERTNLEAMAEALGVLDRVHFLGWRTDRADLLDLCDAVVLTSRHEPFGTVFAQAWGASRPLVTTASQGPAQFVRDGEDALMVDIDDRLALIKAMNRVVSDEKLRRNMVQNGYERYLADFTVQAVLERTMEWYETCLSHSRNKKKFAPE